MSTFFVITTILFLLGYIVARVKLNDYDYKRQVLTRIEKTEYIALEKCRHICFQLGSTTTLLFFVSKVMN